MKLGIHTRLFVISIALILGVWLATGLLLQRRIAAQVGGATERELLRHTSTAAHALAAADQATRGELLRTLGEASDARIVVFDDDGKPQLSSHPSERPAVAGPAVRAVLAGASDSGAAVLAHSHFAARRLQLDGGVAVIRLARDDGATRAAVRQMWWLLGIAAALALLMAVLMTVLSALVTTRSLRRLSILARTIAKKDAPSGPTEPPIDELRDLSGSLTRISSDIGLTVATLAKERALLEGILEGMNDAVIALDGDKRVTQLNAAAMELFGVTEAPIDQPFIELLRAPELVNLIAGPVTAATVEFYHADSQRQLLARVTPLRDQGGCVVVLIDVTEMRRLETVRRDFVANVSHELRTPVTIIRANAETLIDGAMADPVHGVRLLDGVYRNAERLSRIVSDLLDLARLEAGRYEVGVDVVDPGQAIEQAIASVERAAQEKQIKLTLSLETPLRVRADDKALDHVLVNLLDNAVKYSPPGSEVRLTACPAAAGVRISIADNGPGIAAHHRERIFERFYRVDPGRSRDMGGTGLGLSIVKHLVEAMGGSVGIEAAVPRGTCFWIELPAA